MIALNGANYYVMRLMDVIGLFGETQTYGIRREGIRLDVSSLTKKGQIKVRRLDVIKVLLDQKNVLVSTKCNISNWWYYR